MNLDIKLNPVDVKRILGKLQRLTPRKRGQALFNALRRGGVVIERALKLNLSGPILNVRTGFLRSSIQTKVNTMHDRLEVVVGSGVNTGSRAPYADILETTERIRPAKRHYLSKTRRQIDDTVVREILRGINEELKR